MLSALAAENAKPRAKPYLLTDGNGPYLMMTLQGNKLWRLRYRSAGTLVTQNQLLSIEGLPAAAGLLSASSSACILGPMRIVDRVKCSSRGTIRRTTCRGPSDGV